MTALDRITGILVEHLGVAEDAVTPNAKLTEDLGADSLDLVEVALAVEEEFDISLPDDIMGDATVADLVELVPDRD